MFRTRLTGLKKIDRIEYHHEKEYPEYPKMFESGFTGF